MARLLAIDYGQKRTGIAVTDLLQIVPSPLKTVETKALLDFLKTYTAAEDTEAFIVGKPMQTNGRPSENLKHVEAFVAKLKQTIPDIPVHYYDERYTSVLAHKAIIESGVSRKRRQDKALVDEISACIILQGYMDSQRFR